MKGWLLAACVASLLARSAGAADAPGAIELTDEQAAAFAVAAAERADEPIRIAALGAALDPAPFVQTWRAADLARSALAIAERERARVEALARADHNASTRDVEAARLAEERARADRDDAALRAIGLWGRDAIRNADAAFVARLASGDASIARLEIPAGAALPGEPATASIRAPAFDGAPRTARILGAAPNVDPGWRGQAVLVALDPGLPAGAALSGELGFAQTEQGVWVPESAVVWHDGVSALFVAAGAHAFLRRDVSLRRATRPGYFVASGIEPDARLVVTGAQQLLSAQLIGDAAE